MIRIGACATFHDIAASELIHSKFAALWESARHLADQTIRNVATCGGNICTALPSSDSIPSVYAADADLVLVSSKGTRTVKPEEFFTGPRKTILSL